MIGNYVTLTNYNPSIFTKKSIENDIMNMEYRRKPYYNNNNISPHVKFGLDQSGFVYTNPNLYNIKKEDPGISWIV